MRIGARKKPHFHKGTVIFCDSPGNNRGTAGVCLAMTQHISLEDHIAPTPRTVRDSRQPKADIARSRAPSRLRGVVAVVGCDGSGKSTLAADLYAHLRSDHAVELLYLGQGSGQILRSILTIPLIGGAVGHYLSRKSQRAHSDKGKAASPDGITALAIHLLSHWRRHKFRRMLRLDRRATVMIVDRYPQAEAAGFYFDGPGLVASGTSSGFVRWLAAREQRLYQDMATHVPTLIIRLHVDADTAHARKPDHKLAMLRDKVRVIPTLTFNEAPIIELNGCAPYAQVLESALSEARKALMPAQDFDASG